MNPEDKPSVSAQDKREVRADARDVRADARDVRSDALDVDLAGRGVRANIREDVVSNREEIVIKGIRAIKWLICVLIVLVIGSLVRSYIVQGAADDATDAAERVEAATSEVKDFTVESRDASVETLAELRAILQRIEQNNSEDPGPDNRAIIEALQTIARIEGVICNGRCPDPPE